MKSSAGQGREWRWWRWWRGWREWRGWRGWRGWRCAAVALVALVVLVPALCWCADAAATCALGAAGPATSSRCRLFAAPRWLPLRAGGWRAATRNLPTLQELGRVGLGRDVDHAQQINSARVGGQVRCVDGLAAQVAPPVDGESCQPDELELLGLGVPHALRLLGQHSVAQHVRACDGVCCELAGLGGMTCRREAARCRLAYQAAGRRVESSDGTPAGTCCQRTRKGRSRRPAPAGRHGRARCSARLRADRTRRSAPAPPCASAAPSPASRLCGRL